MKLLKRIIITAFMISILTACSTKDEGSYNISEVITFTDVKINMIEGTRYENQGIVYIKEGKESDKISIKPYLYEQLKKIKKMESLSSKEEALYTITTDGNNILMITLSSNTN